MNKIISSILVGFVLVTVRAQVRQASTQWSAAINQPGQIDHTAPAGIGGEMTSLWGGLPPGLGQDLVALGLDVTGGRRGNAAQGGSSVDTFPPPQNNIPTNPGTPDLAQLFVNPIVPDTTGAANTLPDIPPPPGPAPSAGPTAIYGSGRRPGHIDSQANINSIGQTHSNSVFEKGSVNQGELLHRPKRQRPGNNNNRRRNRNRNRGKGSRNRNRNPGQPPYQPKANAGGSRGAANIPNPAMMQMIMQMIASGGGNLDMGMLAGVLGSGMPGAIPGAGVPDMSAMLGLPSATGPGMGTQQMGGLGTGGNSAAAAMGPGGAGMSGAMGTAAMMSNAMALRNGGIGYGKIPRPPPGWVNPLGRNRPYIPGLDAREVADMMGPVMPGEQLPLDLSMELLALRRRTTLDNAVDQVGDMWERRRRMQRIAQMSKLAAAGTRSGPNGAASIVSMPMM